jgi:hypothetical protein
MFKSCIVYGVHFYLIKLKLIFIGKNSIYFRKISKMFCFLPLHLKFAKSAKVLLWSRPKNVNKFNMYITKTQNFMLISKSLKLKKNSPTENYRQKRRKQILNRKA